MIKLWRKIKEALRDKRRDSLFYKVYYKNDLKAYFKIRGNNG